MEAVSVPSTHSAAPTTALVTPEPSSLARRPPRLLGRVREAVRSRQYSRRTEKAYVAWIRRYILLHGKRLRLLECARLRVKDVDSGRHQIIVRAGKGDKDRATTLPAIIRADQARHLDAVKRQHDLGSGARRGLG